MPRPRLQRLLPLLVFSVLFGAAAGTLPVAQKERLLELAGAIEAQRTLARLGPDLAAALAPPEDLTPAPFAPLSEIAALRPPSMAAWWIFMTSAARPSSMPSTTKHSHSGRARSKSCSWNATKACR